MTVWLDSNAYTALQLLVKSQQADASTVTSDAIRYYHAVTSNKPDVTSDNALVTSDVTGDSIPVTGDKPAVTSDVTSDKPSRYMSQELENHILDLRQSGLTLNETARQLADEGHKNAKGAPYSPGTLTKAVSRAQRRQ